MIEALRSPHTYVTGMEYLVEVVQKLSTARSLDRITEITRRAARELANSDGATFVLRDVNLCSYVDEDAITPLWKGRRFPMTSCVSGWAMLNKKAAVIPDIYQDDRVPIEAYRPTFVKSMAMIPIRKEDPIGAIGIYWATAHVATPEQLRLLEALANSTAIALENVRLIENLKKANASLEGTINARDEFLTVASHELKTPLSALLLKLEISRRAVKTGKVTSIHHLSETIESSLQQGQSLARLVEKLMDVSRMRLERLELKIKPTDLSALLKVLIVKYDPLLEAVNCRLTSDIDDDVIGDCDAEAIEEVLSNLIGNVVKYAPGSPVKIALRKPSDGIITLLIEDSGPGVPSMMHEKIFERFGRGMSAANISGFGLGLFIAKNLLLAHGGRIRLENPADGGARFIVELPCKNSQI